MLFQGQPALVSTVTAGVEWAPAGASAAEALRAGLRALCDAAVPEQQEIGRRIGRLVAGSPELQERTASKRAVLTAATEAALLARFAAAPWPVPWRTWDCAPATRASPRGPTPAAPSRCCRSSSTSSTPSGVRCAAHSREQGAEPGDDSGRPLGEWAPWSGECAAPDSNREPAD